MPTVRRWHIRQADCLRALPRLNPDSIDTVITDPPYGISFNNMKWDTPRRLDPARPAGRLRSRENPSVAFQRFCAEWTHQCLRVLKPGAHLAAFAAPRTAHLLACGLEEAGFELRDTLMWIQGQGYPGSRAISPGRGTGLKPAYEPIILARKPVEGTLDHTLAKYGTGALNISTCRITDTATKQCPGERRTRRKPYSANPEGRWPANVQLSHDKRCNPTRCHHDCPVKILGERHRFFYCAKVSQRERNAGCEQLPRRTVQTFKLSALEEQQAEDNPVANIHPTVKPIELMRWLVRLLTPNGGLVLDPFTGSGSTGAAAVLEGARFLGIEREPDYIPIARARITYWARQARGATRLPGKRSRRVPLRAAGTVRTDR